MVAIRLLYAIALFHGIGLAHGAILTAAVDRLELTIDEHVILTLTLDQSDIALRAEGVNPNVDLTRLTSSFTVGTPRVEQRYDSHRPLGRAFSELRVELFPKKTGDLIIPGFQIDGATTQPIALTAKPAAAGAPLAFSEFNVAKTEIYQHQQLLVTLDVYHRTELESAQLGGDLSTAPKPVELFDVYALPASEREETRYGYRYHVVRRSWALFADEAGELTLLVPDVWVVTQSQDRLHLPAGRQTVSMRALPASLPSPTLVGDTSIEIQPIPLPDTGMQSWRIRLRTRAQQDALPARLNFASVPGLLLHNTTAQLGHETTSNGVTHIGDYTLVAQATQAGQYHLPALVLGYFDPDESREKSLTIEIPPFELRPEIRSITHPLPLNSDTDTASTSWKNPYWPLATLFFAALWLATAAWLGRTWRLNKSDPAQPKTTERFDATSRSNSRPLEHQLLLVLHARSLSEGMLSFEAQFGLCAELRTAVTAVQQHYYGPSTMFDDVQIDRLVHDGIAAANSTMQRHQPAADTCFDPRAFTRSNHVTYSSPGESAKTS